MNELMILESYIEEDKPLVSNWIESSQLLIERIKQRKEELPHGHFGKYLEGIGMDKVRLARAKANAELMENLSNVSNLETYPKNEGQARELHKLEPDQQVEVWETVTERYEPKEITAAKINEIKQEILEPDVEVIENNNKEIDKKLMVYSIDGHEDTRINEVMSILGEMTSFYNKKNFKGFKEWLENYLQILITKYEK